MLFNAAALFKAQVCDHSIAGIANSNPVPGIDVSFLCVLLFCVGSGLCGEMISSSEKFYAVCVCVCMCVWCVCNCL